MPVALRFPIIICMTLLFIRPLAADVLTLRNGDRLSGEVVRLKGGALSFRTGYSGVLNVPAGEVVGLTTDKVVTVRYRSGGYRTGRLITSYGGSVRIEGVQGGYGNAIGMDAIAEIYPGREIPRGFQWSGRLNLGATQRSGNTDTRSVHGDTAIKGRSEEDRLRFEGSINKEFNEGERTQDDFTVFAQHDHFVSKSIYFFTNATVTRNEPQDLTLRTIIGTGAGWQVVESAKTNLSLEAGPSYVNEDFETGEDRDFVAGRWAVNFDHYLWDNFVQVFHNHEATVDMENTGNVFVKSSTGFRFPLGKGFNLTAQADVAWDSEPEPGVSSIDKTYLMTVGYSW